MAAYHPPTRIIIANILSQTDLTSLALGEYSLDNNLHGPHHLRRAPIQPRCTISLDPISLLTSLRGLHLGMQLRQAHHPDHQTRRVPPLTHNITHLLPVQPLVLLQPLHHNITILTINISHRRILTLIKAAILQLPPHRLLRRERRGHRSLGKGRIRMHDPHDHHTISMRIMSERPLERELHPRRRRPASRPRLSTSSSL